MCARSAPTLCLEAIAVCDTGGGFINKYETSNFGRLLDYGLFICFLPSRCGNDNLNLPSHGIMLQGMPIPSGDA